jgi:hypothetical protein
MARSNPEGCQTVAGGRSHAETSGIGSRKEMHPGWGARILKDPWVLLSDGCVKLAKFGLRRHDAALAALLENHSGKS